MKRIIIVVVVMAFILGVGSTLAKYPTDDRPLSNAESMELIAKVHKSNTRAHRLVLGSLTALLILRTVLLIKEYRRKY